MKGDEAGGIIIMLLVIAAIVWGVWAAAGDMAAKHNAEGTRPATGCWSWCESHTP